MTENRDDKPGMSVKEFFSNAEHGNLNEIKHAIEELGMPVDVEINGSDTALNKACCHEYYDMVEYLLSKGADTNHKNCVGNHSLIMAAWNNHENIVKLLLDNGADKTISGNRGTATKVAIENGNMSIVKTIKSYRSNGWYKTGDQTIDHCYSEDNGTRHITDVFNFYQKERTRYIKLEDSSELVTFLTPFNQISGIITQEAATELQNRTNGGGDGQKIKPRTVTINQ